MSDVFFLYLFVSLFLSLVLGPLAIWVCRKIGLVDFPKAGGRKTHRRPTPAAGGPLLVTVLLISQLAFPELRESLLGGAMPALLIILAVGIIDDFRELPPAAILAGQLVAAALVIAAGTHVNLFSWDWLNVFVTVFWILGITNAFNFLDSVEGLALGIAIVIAAFMFAASAISGQTLLAGNLVAFLGAAGGFYIYNALPARAFLGNSGAMAIGFVLSLCAINYAPLGYTPLSSWFIPILFFAVPIFDVSLVVVSRIRRGARIYVGGRDHVYHRLKHHTGSELRPQLLMLLAACFFNATALASLNFPPLIGNIMFLLILVFGAGLIVYFENNLPPA